MGRLTMWLTDRLGRGPVPADRIAVLAEYDDPEILAEAVLRLRDLGYSFLDTYSPVNHDEIEAALDPPRSRLPLAALLAGLAGAAGAYGLQLWINVSAYPLDVGGRPLHSAPSFIPITFETAVLFASVTLFVGLFARGGMPRLWRPVFEVPGFDRTTLDRYWLGIDRRDPRFDEAATLAALKALEPAPLRVVAIDDEGTVLRDERRRTEDDSWTPAEARP